MNHQRQPGVGPLQTEGKHDQRSDDIDYELTGVASIDLPFLREVPFSSAAFS